MNNQLKNIFAVLGGFLLLYFLPVESNSFREALLAGVELLHSYARSHVITSLLPAFLIAGAIGAFIRKEQVLKYLGGDVKKHISYLVAAFAGAVLTVCSCTILPFFAGIRRRGAGLGPATVFLVAGPAVNIVAILLTFSVLGTSMGVARIFSAILMAIAVGASMQFIFKEESAKESLVKETQENNVKGSTVFLFILLLLSVIVVGGLSIDIFLKNIIIFLIVILISLTAILGLKKNASKLWINESWDFIKSLAPILFFGIFIAGFITPLLPPEIISNLVGQNSVSANLISSFFGVFMYFSTLTEIPIINTLIGSGMDKGPALALLLAGPSLSLPKLLVVRTILGNKKMIVYALLSGFYAALAGFIFGFLF